MREFNPLAVHLDAWICRLVLEESRGGTDQTKWSVSLTFTAFLVHFVSVTESLIKYIFLKKTSENDLGKRKKENTNLLNVKNETY